MSFVVLGAGSRGRIYTEIASSLGHKLVAYADPDERARRAMNDLVNGSCLIENDAQSLLRRGKLADVAIIATQDALHYPIAIEAMKAGYDILLEKPAACTAEEVSNLALQAEVLGRKLIVCFVLRYTPFYRAVRKFIDSGALGDVLNLNMSEGVGPWHHVHSYVRGHWARSSESPPMIVGKSCHDTDLIAWLLRSRCAEVASFASSSYFVPANQPAGASDRCGSCALAGECRFSAARYITEERRWLSMIHPGAASESDARLLQWVLGSKWGRCAWLCGQDTPDHQVAAFRMESGATATFTMTAFDGGRRIRVHGTLGVLEGAVRADGRPPWLEFRPHFGGQAASIPIEAATESRYEGHAGGDYGLIEALPALLADDAPGPSDCLEGHRMAFAAARVCPSR